MSGTSVDFTLKGDVKRDDKGLLRLVGHLSEPAHPGEVIIVRIDGNPFEVRVVEMRPGSHAQAPHVATLELIDSELNGIVWTERKPRKRK